MSRLDELIAELCLDGVEYKTFGESATIVRGASPRPIKKFITTEPTGVNWIKIGDVKPGDKYITASAEKITIEGAKKSRAVKKGDFILSNSMSFGRPYILQIDGCIHDGWLAISDFSDSYLSDFLYHLLNSNRCQSEMRKRASFGGAVQNLNADIVRSLVLPVPPLEVQREIVHILDHFTLLTAELTAELTARKKQYEYYRDTLLNNNTNTEVEKATLGEISEFVTVGIANSATHSYRDNGVIMFRNQNIKENHLDDSDLIYIDDKFSLKYKNKILKENDILVTRTGYPGKACVVPQKYEGAQTFTTLIVRLKSFTKTNPKYVCYYINSISGKKYVQKMQSGAAQQNFGAMALSNMPIPIPNIDIQKKMVNVLDNFEAICTDLNIGLPAEIEKRQQQYEYYRDMLLTYAATGTIIAHPAYF